MYSGCPVWTGPYCPVLIEDLRKVYSGCPVWTGPHCPVLIEDWWKVYSGCPVWTDPYCPATDWGLWEVYSGCPVWTGPYCPVLIEDSREVYSGCPVWTGPHCPVLIEDCKWGVFRLSSVNRPSLSCTDWGLREVYSSCPVWTGPHRPVLIEDWWKVYSGCPVWTGPYCPVLIEDSRRCIQAVQCEQALTFLYWLRTVWGVFRLSSVNRPSLSCTDWGLLEVYSGCAVWSGPHCPALIEDCGRCIQAVQCEQALTVLHWLRTQGLSSVNRPSLSCIDWGLKEVYSGCPVWTDPYCPVLIEDCGRCIQAVQCEQALTVLYWLRT